MRLDDGWNQIQFNLSDFTRRAYGTNYIETLRVQVSIRVFSFCFCNLFCKTFFYRFTEIVVFDVFTFRIDFILKMNYRRNSNYIYRYVKEILLISNVFFLFYSGAKEIIAYIFSIYLSFFFLKKTKIKIYTNRIS